MNTCTHCGTSGPTVARAVGSLWYCVELQACAERGLIRRRGLGAWAALREFSRDAVSLSVGQASAWDGQCRRESVTV